ncbi:MAG: hypothetical protein KDD58_08280 [Bdellovibrionales bacterium]|nr:hypothetical protein [Bdellovibrionales bacterium]
MLVKKVKISLLFKVLIVIHLLLLFFVSLPTEFILYPKALYWHNDLSNFYKKYSIRPGTEVFKGPVFDKLLSNYCIKYWGEDNSKNIKLIFVFPENCKLPFFNSEMSNFEKIHVLPIFFKVHFGSKDMEHDFSILRHDHVLKAVLESYCNQFQFIHLTVSLKTFNIKSKEKTVHNNLINTHICKPIVGPPDIKFSLVNNDDMQF